MLTPLPLPWRPAKWVTVSLSWDSHFFSCHVSHEPHRLLGCLHYINETKSGIFIHWFCNQIFVLTIINYILYKYIDYHLLVDPRETLKMTIFFKEKKNIHEMSMSVSSTCAAVYSEEGKKQRTILPCVFCFDIYTCFATRLLSAKLAFNFLLMTMRVRVLSFLLVIAWRRHDCVFTVFFRWCVVNCTDNYMVGSVCPSPSSTHSFSKEIPLYFDGIVVSCRCFHYCFIF